MTHNRRMKNLSSMNKAFDVKKKKSKALVLAKGIMIVSGKNHYMKECECGSKQFDRNTDKCTVCGKE